jgi:hypothetical protein
MRIQAAVLRQPGLPPPYAQSKPLEIAELDLSPRPRRSPGADQGGGPVPFGPVGDRRLAATAHPDGARPRSGRNCRGGRRWSDRPRSRRSRGAGFRPELRTIAVDLSDEKLAFATKLGATQTVNARSNDAVGEIRRMSGAGVDVAFEMAGSVPALELAYAATARGGMTVTAGLPHPDKRMTLPPLALVAKERTLKGSYMSARRLPSATCRA